MALEGTGILIAVLFIVIIFFFIFAGLFIGNVGLLGRYKPMPPPGISTT
jgi:hypothetical protein